MEFEAGKKTESDTASNHETFSNVGSPLSDLPNNLRTLATPRNSPLREMVPMDVAAAKNNDYNRETNPHNTTAHTA